MDTRGYPRLVPLKNRMVEPKLSVSGFRMIGVDRAVVASLGDARPRAQSTPSASRVVSRASGAGSGLGSARLVDAQRAEAERLQRLAARREPRPSRRRLTALKL